MKYKQAEHQTVSIEPASFKLKEGEMYMCIKDWTCKEMYHKGNIYTAVLNKNIAEVFLMADDGSSYPWYTKELFDQYFRPATEEEIESFKQNSAQKPKFNTGDWVVAISSGNLFKILSVNNGLYKVLCKDGIEANYPFKDVDNDLRLWTIADAKDGDVLTYRENQWIFIFKAFGATENEIAYYTLLSEEGLTFNSYNYSVLQCAFKPATKEQRDLLFQKMHKAGYEWDAEKKVLNKLVEPKQETSDGELTEFEKSLLEWFSIYNPNSENKKQYAIDAAAELIPIARKQFIKEACEWVRKNADEYTWCDENFNSGIGCKMIEDFRNALEKGGKNE